MQLSVAGAAPAGAPRLAGAPRAAGAAGGCGAGRQRAGPERRKCSAADRRRTRRRRQEVRRPQGRVSAVRVCGACASMPSTSCCCSCAAAAPHLKRQAASGCALSHRAVCLPAKPACTLHMCSHRAAFGSSRLRRQREHQAEAVYAELRQQLGGGELVELPQGGSLRLEARAPSDILLSTCWSRLAMCAVCRLLSGLSMLPCFAAMQVGCFMLCRGPGQGPPLVGSRCPSRFQLELRQTGVAFGSSGGLLRRVAAGLSDVDMRRCRGAFGLLRGGDAPVWIRHPGARGGGDTLFVLWHWLLIVEALQKLVSTLCCWLCSAVSWAAATQATLEHRATALCSFLRRVRSTTRRRCCPGCGPCARPPAPPRRPKKAMAACPAAAAPPAARRPRQRSAWR